MQRNVLTRRRGTYCDGGFTGHVLPALADRVLPFDLSATRVLATYRVPEHARSDDALIAAVAQAGDLTVATRNTKHFEPLGVRVIDPWAEA